MGTDFPFPPLHSQYLLGGVLSVTVIVIGNGIGDLKFKSWTKLYAFYLALMLLEKAWIHMFFPTYGEMAGYSGFFSLD